MILFEENFDQEQIVYEQFADYGYFLVGNSKYVLLDQKYGLQGFKNEKSLTLIANEKFILNDTAALKRLVIGSRDKKVTFKYFSARQAERCYDILVEHGFAKSVRSNAEIIFDVAKIIDMEGSGFSKLRNKRKIISNIDFKFKRLDKTTIVDAITVIKSWRANNQSKYLNDRTQNEISLVEAIANNLTKETFGKILYFQSTPIGVYVMNISRLNTAIFCLTKGVRNLELPESKYSSTAIYLDAFHEAYVRGIKYVNDGELGLESGTISHKNHLAPIELHQTFDFIYKGSGDE